MWWVSILAICSVQCNQSEAYFVATTPGHNSKKVAKTSLLFLSQGNDGPSTAATAASTYVQWNGETTSVAAAITANKTAVRRPKSLPFVAGLKYLQQVSKGTPHYYQTRLMEEHGESFIIWNKYVTLTDPAAIRDVLEVYNLEKAAETTKAFQTLFFPTGGILAAPWKEWIEQRRLTAPALSEVVIGELAPKFEQASQTMFERLLEEAAQTGRVVEMDQVFVALTVDTIGLVTLGRSFGMSDRIALQNETVPVPFLAALDVMGGEAMRVSVLPKWVLKLWRPSAKVRRAKRTLTEFLEDCINERLAVFEETRNQTNLLNILLDAESKGLITRDDVKAQLLTFIFAGYDTTAHTLSYLLYEVSVNQELQEQVAEEAKRALPNRSDFPLDPKILSDGRLSLLDKVWKETLRKHPATATGTVRQVGDKAIVVGDGLELPPNVQVSMPPYCIHRNRRYWPDPEVFDPSRFEPELEKERDSMSLQSFSAGPRSCIGARLARAEVLSFMSTLFRRFEVTCVETEEPESRVLFTTAPRNGIRFTFSARP
jgi:cytochrome P450